MYTTSHHRPEEEIEMSDEIVLYHNPRSRGRMVHWMLEELGAPYRIELVRFDRGEHKSPEFLELNPMGKLPTIEHRGVVVTETAAIITYLADAHAAAGLAPTLDDPERGTYLRWLFFTAGCLEPAALDRALDRPAPERSGALGYGSYEDTLDALETALEPGPWILGDRFSAADVYVGSQIVWGLGFGSIEERDIFTAYAERCEARPAYRRTVEHNEELGAQLEEG
jgi:glutathione S-transferase